jgi:hypothetical protein
VGDQSPWPREAAIRRYSKPLADLVACDANEGDTRLLVSDIPTLAASQHGWQQGRTRPLDRSTVPESVIDRIGSVDNPMSVRRTSGTLARRRRSAPMAIIEHKRPARTAAAKTMRAAVVEDFARPLVVNQVAKPVAGQGEIVVRIETSGLCHTDIHAAHGDRPVKPSPPFIPCRTTREGDHD